MLRFRKYKKRFRFLALLFFFCTQKTAVADPKIRQLGLSRKMRHIRGKANLHFYQIPGCGTFNDLQKQLVCTSRKCISPTELCLTGCIFSTRV
jgi:hypothetical protein